MTEIEPGWYKDPAEPTTQRYWDGSGWTGDPLPVDATPPPGPPPGPAPAVFARPFRVPPATPATPPRTTRPPEAAPPRVPPGPPGYPPGTPLPPGKPLPPGTPVPGVALPPGVRWVGSMGLVIAPPRPHGLPVAPLGLRVLARLIDFGVLLGLNVLGNGWLIYLFFSDLTPWARAVWRAAQTGGSPNTVPVIPDRVSYLVALIPMVIAALWLAYEVPAIAQRGQTFGKRVVGIKVLRLESTEPLGFARALRRWNPLGLPVLLWVCGLGFLLQLVDVISPVMGGPLHLALHDRSAATVVVHSGRKGHEIQPVHIPEPPGEES